MTILTPDEYFREMLADAMQVLQKGGRYWPPGGGIKAEVQQLWEQLEEAGLDVMLFSVQPYEEHVLVPQSQVSGNYMDQLELIAEKRHKAQFLGKKRESWPT